jgi:serine protease inhibitor
LALAGGDILADDGDDVRGVAGQIMVIMKAMSAPLTQPFTPVVKADRPFLFLIRDMKTGSLLFLGRMMNPKELG